MQALAGVDLDVDVDGRGPPHARHRRVRLAIQCNNVDLVEGCNEMGRCGLPPRPLRLQTGRA